jgi:hypothetical protein
LLIKKSAITSSTRGNILVENQLLQHTLPSKCLAVFFPGAGYSCESPLLYYTRKASLLNGCDTLSLQYGFQVVNEPFSTETSIDEIMDETFRIVEQVREKYEKMIFVSKSLGTVIAGRQFDKLVSKDVHSFYMTPILESLQYIEKSGGIVVAGSNDKHLSDEAIGKLKAYNNVKTIWMPEATHSLEINDNYNKSLEILTSVTNLCAKFVHEVSREK